jgi:uncharacterized protein (TIGR00369 family)
VLAKPIEPAEWEAFGPPRSRTISWYAPGPVTAKGMSMPGIDYLKALMSAELPPPPISELMQMRFQAVEGGRVVITNQPDESFYNATGTVHGGLVCTLLDTAAGCALQTVLPKGKAFTSVEIKVSYLKAVHPHRGLLTTTGSVVRAGARVGFTQAVTTDANGSVVATASSTLLIFDL